MIYVCCICGAKLQQSIQLSCHDHEGKHDLCMKCYEWWVYVSNQMENSDFCPSRPEDLMVLRMMR